MELECDCLKQGERATNHITETMLMLFTLLLILRGSQAARACRKPMCTLHCCIWYPKIAPNKPRILPSEGTYSQLCNWPLLLPTPVTSIVHA